MLLFRHGEHASLIFEVRLCCLCKRMFYLNDHQYRYWTHKGMFYYSHVKCPEQKPEPKLLERR